MQIYRVYKIGTDGERAPPVDLRCKDDDDARQLAQRLIRFPGHKVELWGEEQLIGILTAADASEVANLTVPWKTAVVRG